MLCRYMEHKVDKLQEQFQADQAVTLAQREASGATPHGVSSLFQGVTLFVNGYTIPPHQVMILPVVRNNFRLPAINQIGWN